MNERSMRINAFAADILQATSSTGRPSWETSEPARTLKACLPCAEHNSKRPKVALAPALSRIMQSNTLHRPGTVSGSRMIEGKEAAAAAASTAAAVAAWGGGGPGGGGRSEGRGPGMLVVVLVAVVFALVVVMVSGFGAGFVAGGGGDNSSGGSGGGSGGHKRCVAAWRWHKLQQAITERLPGGKSAICCLRPLCFLHLSNAAGRGMAITRLAHEILNETLWHC